MSRPAGVTPWLKDGPVECFRMSNEEIVCWDGDHLLGKVSPRVLCKPDRWWWTADQDWFVLRKGQRATMHGTRDEALAELLPEWVRRVG